MIPLFKIAISISADLVDESTDAAVKSSEEGRKFIDYASV